MGKEEIMRHAAVLEGLSLQVDRCREDFCRAVERGRISLEEQVRAYDLADRLLETGKDTLDYADETLGTSMWNYIVTYDKQKDSGLYDMDTLMQEAENLLAPLQEKMNEARFEAASAASLHEFAKEVFEIWQTSGIFARKRALRELRERAGFRLESHRIGNYVAKTFDLMNEAQARFAKAQQALFASDVRYKVSPGIFGRIRDLLPKMYDPGLGADPDNPLIFCGVKYRECLEGPRMPINTVCDKDIYL